MIVISLAAVFWMSRCVTSKKRLEIFLQILDQKKFDAIIIIYFPRPVLVFEITKTPKFPVKFDLKLDGKNQTEDNLTD